MRFDNDLISFDVPCGWDVEEDDSGNLLCFSPDDPSVWIQVELGGVRKPGSVISASSFLDECYSAEISGGDAILRNLDSETAFVTRSLSVQHGDTPYIVFYVHLAHNQSIDNVQMAQFGLACPEDRSATEEIANLRSLFDEIPRSTAFQPWSDAT